MPIEGLLGKFCLYYGSLREKFLIVLPTQNTQLRNAKQTKIFNADTNKLNLSIFCYIGLSRFSKYRHIFHCCCSLQHVLYFYK